jgi:DNA-binding NtrC family response regulator
MILEEYGHSVDMFTDPSLALSKFEPQTYRLAIIDLIMAGMDGLELYRRLHVKDHKMKVCFISGYEYAEALSKFQNKHCEVSADCFFKKPLNIDHFIKVVERMTGEK